MKLGVLFSGGKDSCLAAALAQEHGHELVLLSMVSQNADSYMFHTPNIDVTSLQAEAMGLPILTGYTKGEKEKELDDLQELITKAITEHQIEGVVTGALASVYQATRVQKICHELDLWCFNPLWQRDEYEHACELVMRNYEVYISAVAAYPLGEEFLGRRLDKALLLELKTLQEKNHISPSGEGGEFETFVAHGPGWKKRITNMQTAQSFSEGAGKWLIHDAELVDPPVSTCGSFNYDKQLVHEHIIQPTFGPTLLISTCKEKLHELEFVTPIARVLDDNCAIKHYTEEYNPDDFERVIICGTALKDDAFIQHLDSFAWIKNYDKPILGICAGFQILGLINGEELGQELEIGLIPQKIETALGTVKEIYLLHHNCLKSTKYYFEKGKHYGILFHPEVRNTELIKKFLEL